jgi:hypothetical protein
VTAATELLHAWLRRQLDVAPLAWLEDQLQRLAAGCSDRDFFLAVSYVPRKLGKADLRLGPDELRAADAATPGWDPSDWSVDQAARILFLLVGGGTGDGFAQRLKQLFVTADIGETITFYRGLPLYPDPDRHVARAREGARSGMRPIFEAVAHHNPYPAQHFDELAWNHLVLKALFIGTTLAPIQGLDRRANASLARMLCDYAHERWAAGRPVSPELWRCVGPHADSAALDDLQRVLATGSGHERAAAALALRSCPDARAATMLAGEPELAADLAAGRLDWSKLADA